MSNSKDAGRISLRLPRKLFEEIDQSRQSRPGNISRNTWIAEAVKEKLTRDKERNPED